MVKYDFGIVGAGLYGSIMANRLSKKGYKCLLIDKRGHIAGNCFSEKRQDIHVHKYGPHIFHGHSKKIWDYVNEYADFYNYKHVVKANYKGKMITIPVNLTTLEEVLGTTDYTPLEVVDNTNFETYLLSRVPKEIYNSIYYGYTKKQWNTEPKNLPSSIAARLPIRQNRDDCYFTEEFQGIPKDGYTSLVHNIISEFDIHVRLGVDFFDEREKLEECCKTIIYSGPLDKLFGYEYGELPYRSLRFVETLLKIPSYQSHSIINYTHESVNFTRITEHKKFDEKCTNTSSTIITHEYPQNYVIGYNDPYYPINTQENNLIAKKYKDLAASNIKYKVGGRLGSYQYYDMSQVIAQALADSEKFNDRQ